jgi:hypothetical protein
MVDPMMDFLSTLSSWCLSHGPMFAYVGALGLLMAFAHPFLMGLWYASRERREEKIRVLARARAQYESDGGAYWL